MKLLITGASGFIGSHLVRHFSLAGHEVTAFCRTPQKIRMLAHPRVQFVQGLLEDFALLARLVQGQDAVIHCALGWGTTAVEMLQRDTLPAVHLFERAMAAGVKKIIFTSSCVAVGEYRGVMDEDTACRPLDFYGATKCAVEGYLLAQSRATATECNIIRPCYTFGHPAAAGCASQPDRRFWNFAHDALEGAPIRLIRNEGTQFIWIGDLVRLYEHFLQASCTRVIVNAGCDFHHSWESIATKIISRLNSSSRIDLTDLGWQPNGSLWSNARMRKILPAAADCAAHLQDHIKYVCDNSPASGRPSTLEGAFA
jgi:UDP-glucose 4-epimerase